MVRWDILLFVFIFLQTIASIAMLPHEYAKLGKTNFQLSGALIGTVLRYATMIYLFYKAGGLCYL